MKLDCPNSRYCFEFLSLLVSREHSVYSNDLSKGSDICLDLLFETLESGYSDTLNSIALLQFICLVESLKTIDITKFKYLADNLANVVASDATLVCLHYTFMKLNLISKVELIKSKIIYEACIRVMSAAQEEEFSLSCAIEILYIFGDPNIAKKLRKSKITLTIETILSKNDQHSGETLKNITDMEIRLKEVTIARDRECELTRVLCYKKVEALEGILYKANQANTILQKESENLKVLLAECENNLSEQGLKFETKMKQMQDDFEAEKARLEKESLDLYEQENKEIERLLSRRVEKFKI